MPEEPRKMSLSKKSHSYMIYYIVISWSRISSCITSKQTNNQHMNQFLNWGCYFDLGHSAMFCFLNGEVIKQFFLLGCSSLKDFKIDLVSLLFIWENGYLLPQSNGKNSDIKNEHMGAQRLRCSMEHLHEEVLFNLKKLKDFWYNYVTSLNLSKLKITDEILTQLCLLPQLEKMKNENTVFNIGHDVGPGRQVPETEITQLHKVSSLTTWCNYIYSIQLIRVLSPFSFCPLEGKWRAQKHVSFVRRDFQWRECIRKGSRVGNWARWSLEVKEQI